MNLPRTARKSVSRKSSSSLLEAACFEVLEPRTLLTTFNPHDGPSLGAILAGTNSGTKLALGDTIILDAGVKYQQNLAAFTLKRITQSNSDPNNDGWITIKSSMLDQLPVGKRVSYTDGQYMPKLWAGGNNTNAVNAQAGANHYKFLGVEFVGYMQLTKDLVNTSLTSIVDLGDSSNAQTTVPGDAHEEPHDIVIDRVYFHPEFITVDLVNSSHNGTARDNDAYLGNTYTDLRVRRAIALHASRVDITNSYIREMHEGSDSNAIFGVNGSGPYNIINNHLEGAGENILFGGATQFSHFPDSNVVFRGNHVIKPLDWRNGTNGSQHWTVKNLFEIKEGSHFVIEDNIFENAWADGQAGIAILFKLGDYDDSTAAGGTVVDEDVIFRNNIVRHAAGGITFQGRDYAATPHIDPGGLVRRFKIENNLWDDIASYHYDNATPPNRVGNWGGISPFAYALYGPKNVEFRHNTIMASYTPLELDDNLFKTTSGTAPGPWPAPGFVFTDNIVNMNDYGIRGSSGSGDDAIHKYLPDGLFKGNVFVDTHTDVSSPGLYDNVAPASWPGNLNAPRVRYVNFFARNDGVTNNVGYVDSANGNYRLTPSAASTYINGVAFHDTMESPAVDGMTRTTDGKAPGVDFDVLDGVLAGAISGVWQFAYVVNSRLFVHFDGSGTPISLSLSGSNLVVSAPGQTTLTVQASSITGISVVDSTGNDTLLISGAVAPAMIQQTNTSGNDLIQLSGGSFSFDSDLSTGSQYWSVPNWGVYVASGATATFNSTQHLRSLSVDGTANLSAGASKVLSVTDLQVTGKINLNDNDLIWDYTAGSPIGAWAGSAYSGLTGLIQSGRASGAWTGNGLTTSQSNAAGSSPLTTLGVAEASDVLTYANGVATYAGQAVDSTAVIVKYTYIGDANLSGRMDGDDYFRIDSSYSGGTPSFLHGDFNLDGKINADDYFLLDAKVNKQGTLVL